MTLFEALRILATVHTADDHLSGFTVETSPAIQNYRGFDQHDRYIKAWETVRRELGLPVDPPLRALEDAIPEAMPQG